MRKLNRAAGPQVLIERGAKWTADLLERGRWTDWPQYNKLKLNHILLDEGLRDQTQEHCSYCDMNPISPPGTETIDHFRPKSGPMRRPDLAYEWANLFYCCNHCQRHKGDLFEKALLKPDEADYDFESYFQWDFATGDLKPNEIASAENQHRAERTIEILKLDVKHPALRLKAWRAFATRDSGTSIDDFSYRDFLECASD